MCIWSFNEKCALEMIKLIIITILITGIILILLEIKA